MPTHFVDYGFGDRGLNLAFDRHFEDALRLAAEHEAGEVNVRV
jgi:hypothetical protein